MAEYDEETTTVERVEELAQTLRDAADALVKQARGLRKPRRRARADFGPRVQRKGDGVRISDTLEDWVEHIVLWDRTELQKLLIKLIRAYPRTKDDPGAYNEGKDALPFLVNWANTTRKLADHAARELKNAEQIKP